MSYSGSGTTWTDLSSSSNNGTLTNGPTFDSGNSGVLVFDGTNDYVQTGSDMFDANADFTFSMWFNSDTFAASTSYSLIADVANSGSLFVRYRDSIQVIKSNTGILGTFSNSTLSTNTWYNLTITRTISGSTRTYTLYINGSSTSSITDNNEFTHSADTIGATHSTSSPSYKDTFDGKIAQVFAYSSALSASEVLANYNATKSNYHELITTNLVLHLDAGNSSSYSGIGTTWTDLSNQGNNATLTNGPTYSSDNGGAIVFDGSNDYVSLGTSINSNIAEHKNCSFNIWVQLDNDTSDHVIFANDELGTGTPIVLWYDQSAYSTNNTGTGDVGGQTTKVLTVAITDNSYGEKRYTTTNNVFGNNAANTWHNICVVLDPSNDKFYTYVNGVEKALYNSSVLLGIKSSTKDFNIGNGSSSFSLDGKVAQLQVYDVALTANQVLQNYNATKATFGY